ncbi:uncharacterized protein N7484_001715 [Penicillium longicatenatum]|uniref:uncharacterized protein n=1 Tax=Penicillium longicatenatum TaxID=1561947 RepID=UPI002548977E|nr:uncharacterized protein N7484_001715 [Penicillium longicatenatum]KAJ5658066.1 hypothetical protein N7484_001715 [Penicillium longicatenatum]
MNPSSINQLALENLLNNNLDHANQSMFEKVMLAVKSQPEDKRYAFQVDVMEHLMKLQDENSDAVSRWYSYVLESGVWKNERNQPSFNEEWQRAR